MIRPSCETEVGATTLVGRGLISDDIINQIRDRVDIAEVVGHHVSLTRAGQNLKGLCPFHQEKSPSFTVNSSTQIFHCFGCNTGGNVFTFLTRITGANFPEVVRDLGQKVGIDVPDSRRVSPVLSPRRRVGLSPRIRWWWGGSGRIYDDPNRGKEARDLSR